MTVNVYDVPFVSPPIVIGLAEPLAVLPPGDDVTVYDVIGEPPFEAGAAKDTVAAPLLAVAETAVGAPGTVITVTGNAALAVLPRVSVAEQLTRVVPTANDEPVAGEQVGTTAPSTRSAAVAV